jgi:hypothetical protein
MNAGPVAPAQADTPDLRPGSAVGLPPSKRPRKPRRKPPINPPEQPSAKAAKSPSAGGSNLADIPQVKWEAKKDGGLEAWDRAPGARRRKKGGYLGRVGKRQLEKWNRLDAGARREAVEGWVAMKREKKGIQ